MGTVVLPLCGWTLARPRSSSSAAPNVTPTIQQQTDLAASTEGPALMAAAGLLWLCIDRASEASFHRTNHWRDRANPGTGLERPWDVRLKGEAKNILPHSRVSHPLYQLEALSPVTPTTALRIGPLHPVISLSLAAPHLEVSSCVPVVKLKRANDGVSHVRRDAICSLMDFHLRTKCPSIPWAI